MSIKDKTVIFEGPACWQFSTLAHLLLTTQGEKKLAYNLMKDGSYKFGLHILYELSPRQHFASTVEQKFLEKKEKPSSVLSSAEFGQRLLKVNTGTGIRKHFVMWPLDCLLQCQFSCDVTDVTKIIC